MSDALPLPPRPNLEHYKKLAKELLKAVKSADPAALRAWAARWAERLAGMEVIAPLYDSTKSEFRERAIMFLSERVARVLATVKRRPPALADAQFAIARLHGFLSWPKFAKHIEAVTHANSAVSKFEAAADAIVSGDIATLRKLLRENPSLARARSTREHRSTLLHYVSANGIEDFRQKTPKNIVEITELLLAAGADVNAVSEAYGGGSTALGLAATSCHPADAGVQLELMQALLDGGSRLDQPSAAGNAQSIVKGCFANGQPQAAEFLASRGAPIDLEEAIALGQIEVVKSYFDSSGQLRADANREHLASGFQHACGCGRAEMVRFLLDRGVDARTASRHGETGLHWAAYTAHAEVAKLLLERGCPVNAVETAYGGTPLGWALYGWCGTSPGAARERYYGVVELLIAAGATIDHDWLVDPKRGMAMLKKIEADSRMLKSLKLN